MIEIVLTGLVAVGVPIWLVIEEVIQRRQARSRADVRVAGSEPELEPDLGPGSQRAATVARALSRKPARAGYAG